MRKVAGGMLLLLVSACGGTPEEQVDAKVVAPSETEMEMEGHAGMSMEGMDRHGAMASAGMMEEMKAHMHAMHGATGDRLAAMVPMHRRMTASLLSQMNREMRDMGMAEDAAWTATVDSLRQDLVRMPEMTAAEMEAWMPAHHARVERLMEMHRAMM